MLDEGVVFLAKVSGVAGDGFEAFHHLGVGVFEFGAFLLQVSHGVFHVCLPIGCTRFSEVFGNANVVYISPNSL
jgi:hypothetical protein